MNVTKALISNPFMHSYFYLTPVIHYKQVCILTEQMYSLKDSDSSKIYYKKCFGIFESLESG